MMFSIIARRGVLADLRAVGPGVEIEVDAEEAVGPLQSQRVLRSGNRQHCSRDNGGKNQGQNAPSQMMPSVRRHDRGSMLLEVERGGRCEGAIVCQKINAVIAGS